MKKLLLIAAVASLATPAFASKARLNSLGNAEHLKDTQTLFNNPSHAVLMADFATFELGDANTNFNALSNILNGTNVVPTNSALAEGGFVRSSGDAKYMVYLGRKSDFTHTVRPALGFLGQENPIELQYAMKGAINWGVGLNYSSSDKKAAAIDQKQSSTGIRLGASTDLWEGYAIIGLGSEATGTSGVTYAAPVPSVTADQDAKYKGTAGFKFGGSYKMENIYLYAKYYQDGAKFESTQAANAATWNGIELAQSQIDLGVVDHNKIEGGQWFYGVAYQMKTTELKGAANANLNQKIQASYLPFLVGVEYDMNSWSTLRASVTQNVLLGSKKVETASASNTDTIDNNTTVGAGVAFRLNKFVIDAALQAASTGDLEFGDGTANNGFLTNVALTYSF